MGNIKLIDAVFLQSAQSLKDSPAQNQAEVAFLGRSNVGKSSLLNSLTKRKNLAKSSSTPGKTQLINYFDVTFKDYDSQQNYFAKFVDLPGFGYAKVSKSLKESWHRNLTAYLEERASIQIFVHLIDSRHPDLDIDQNVDEFLEHIKTKDQLLLKVFTKTDKLKQSDLSKLKNKYKDGVFISNLKNKGIIELENRISEYLFSSFLPN